MKLVLESRAFLDGATIPQKNTCDGENLSPPLRWTALPTETVSCALVIDDPHDAMDTWVHRLI